MSDEFGEDETSEKIITDYNSAALMNMRVDEILKDINKHKRKAEFCKWNADLDTFWCEIGADTVEGGDEDKKIISLNMDLLKVSPLLDWNNYSKGFNELTKQQELLKNKQYQILNKKEMYIRRLMSSQGKLTKKRDESSHYMDT